MSIKSEKVKFVTRAGIIGAIYCALTIAIYPFSFGAVQFRISEILTLLPFFLPEAVPGLYVGCIISNLLSPNIVPLDVIFGSLATLLGGLFTAKCKRLWLAPLPPVIFNALIVGGVITASAASGEAIPPLFVYNALSVGIGEAVVCFGAGLPIAYLLRRRFFSPEHRRLR